MIDMERALLLMNVIKASAEHGSRVANNIGAMALRELGELDGEAKDAMAKILEEEKKAAEAEAAAKAEEAEDEEAEVEAEAPKMIPSKSVTPTSNARRV